MKRHADEWNRRHGAAFSVCSSPSKACRFTQARQADRPRCTRDALLRRAPAAVVLPNHHCRGRCCLWLLQAWWHGSVSLCRPCVCVCEVYTLCPAATARRFQGGRPITLPAQGQRQGAVACRAQSRLPDPAAPRQGHKHLQQSPVFRCLGRHRLKSGSQAASVGALLAGGALFGAARAQAQGGSRDPGVAPSTDRPRAGPERASSHAGCEGECRNSAGIVQE